MTSSTTPAYNLKAVLKETGIAADTLRAWERRYGLPMPERTLGGHRLYSQRDIETIKWLMRQQAGGLSISHAVDLWNDQVASGSDPLADSVSTGPARAGAGALDSAREDWMRACLGFDETAADAVLNQAFAMYPVESVVTGILQRGLSLIGDKWYLNEVTVQQEHFASALAHRRLDGLIAAAPPPTRSQSVMVGCTAGERHVVPALLLTLLLRRRGHPVVYLDADVPIMQFDETVGQIQPALVVLIAQQLYTASRLRDTAALLAASNVPVAYGGRIFSLRSDLRGAIPAHFLGETLAEAVQHIEILLAGGPPPAPEAASPGELSETAVQFRRHRPIIDLHMLTEAHRLGLPLEFINISIQSLGDNLESAMSLDRLDAVTSELEWVSGLLHGHDAGPASLSPFLISYAASIESVMGESGRAVAGWLTSQARS